MVLAVALALSPATVEHVRKQVADLAAEFRGEFSSETVEATVRLSLDRFSDIRFEDFVPVLVHRFSREQLIAAKQRKAAAARQRPAASIDGPCLDPDAEAHDFTFG